MPGVRKVYTAANIGLADFQGFAMMPEALTVRRLPATVRFVGDIVVAVVAETKAQAVDAGEAIARVDYDPLPVAATIEVVAAADAPLLPEHGSNVRFSTARRGRGRPRRGGQGRSP